MALTKSQIKFLRSLAHARKPAIWLGQHGLTDAVLAEIEIALEHHELVKIRLRVGDRKLRDEIIRRICDETRSESIQRIGNIVAIYRMNRKQPGIVLPN